MIRSRNKRGFALALLLISALVLAACSGQGSGGSGNEDTANAIPIGALPPLTGAGAAYGTGMLKAMEIAVAEVNEAGGPLGRPLRLFTEDAQTDPDAAVRGARKLIDVNKVTAIFGTWDSSSTLAVAPLTIEAGIIEMSTSGSDEITNLNDNDLVFRPYPPGVLTGEAMGRTVFELGFTTAATMAINNPSGLSDIGGFEDYFTANGGTVLESVVYNPDQTSYKSEVNKALAAGADIVAISGYTPDMTIILKEAYETGSPGKWLGPAYSINDTMIDALGHEALEGVMAIDAAPDVNSPTYAALAEKYREAMNADLVGNVYAAQSYDMVIMTALAMEKCGCTDGPGIAKHLRDVTGTGGEKVYSFADGVRLLREGKEIDYDGASGPLDFDENGDPRPNFGLYVVRNGQLELEAVISLQD